MLEFFQDETEDYLEWYIDEYGFISVCSSMVE